MAPCESSEMLNCDGTKKDYATMTFTASTSSLTPEKEKRDLRKAIDELSYELIFKTSSWKIFKINKILKKIKGKLKRIEELNSLK